ncbi:multiple sugar transport system permease protein [Microbacterium trichothecenolyticum]|uniref:carbohydrate ABC transporter permease n=1 Tax=Microbacterium trichothecenolyticum TaxID=69370 RepID=UPI00285C5158|nr:sugar ABC transporter permease [Microbacterium trichothecenolyticum]MDR7183547.1 multiple sugar transport system permease protein [Microbacterium trichothecenolyticum]
MTATLPERPAPAAVPPPATPPARRKTRRTPLTWYRGGGLANLLFVLPMVFVFFFFSWSPIVQSVIMSLQKTNLLVSEWVGLDNYVAVLTDPQLGRAVVNTVYFALLALLLGFPLPLFVAVLMSEVRRGKGLYSALAYLPVVIPPVVAVLLWKFFYSADPSGVFNTVLSWFGIPPQPWISSAVQAMPSLVLEATWAAAGGSIIIYLAALLSVPPELYDAAEVDGAGIWRKVWHVTIPQLRGILFIMLILQVIATAQVFLEPFLFTGGGPAGATKTILLYIYDKAFRNSLGGDYGEATAVSVLLAVVLAILSWLYFKLTNRWSTS